MARRDLALLLAGIASSVEPVSECDKEPQVLATGWYEVAIRLNTDGRERTFIAKEDEIDAAAFRFCASYASASPDCQQHLAARAAEVRQRCPVLIMMADAERLHACRWVRAPRPMTAASRADGSLVSWFNAYAEGPLLFKYNHYFEVYDRHLARFKDTQFRMLEIGTARGGSIRMWREWLGARFEHHCVDIDASVAGFHAPSRNTYAHCGNQSDPQLLARLVAETGGFDVVLDDGSHVVAEQLVSFHALFPSLRPGGVYIVEDTHTSLWPAWGGGAGRGFLRFAASSLVDAMHMWHAPSGDGDWRLAQSVRGVSMYESVVVIEKHARAPIGPSEFAPAIRGGDLDEQDQVAPEGDWVVWPV